MYWRLSLIPGFISTLFPGTVDAHQQLDCEVVFHPSYLAPDEGKFSLKVSVLVHEGGMINFMLSTKTTCGGVSVHFARNRLIGQCTSCQTSIPYFSIQWPSPSPPVITSCSHKHVHAWLLSKSKFLLVSLYSFFKLRRLFMQSQYRLSWPPITLSCFSLLAEHTWWW